MVMTDVPVGVSTPGYAGVKGVVGITGEDVPPACIGGGKKAVDFIQVDLVV